MKYTAQHHKQIKAGVKVKAGLVAGVYVSLTLSAGLGNAQKPANETKAELTLAPPSAV